jgi:hypothetical protein
MIVEATLSKYLGVICTRCKERIPVSSKSARLYEESKLDDTTQPAQDLKVYAFALRCKACSAEGMYDLSAIQEFEGVPRNRASPITNQTSRQRRTRR